ncbi:MAG: lipid-A-disaccharide synthase [Candidatus Kryptonium sp.]|nr:lipid-A-disaccharide synthase [Candidatus Kryptonium sp.]MDW8108663.1 lipid-A-disaccharide synthase [Candidatus Kryptonium sp.]
MPKRLMVIAGEVSGDSHAGKVICKIKKNSPDVEVFGVGGERMKKCGAELIYDISEISLIGFVDVLKSFGKIIELENLCKSELLRRKPDAVLLVDYPGFNLRFARFAKENGFRVFYYIAPQVWAWGRRRVKVLKNYVDELFVIFRFEEEFFKKYGIKAEFVGHPLLEDLSYSEMQDGMTFLEKYGISNKKIISFFPGSRTQEVKMMLKTMVEAGKMIKERFDVEIVFSRAKTIDETVMKNLIKEGFKEFKFITDSHMLLRFSHIAVVKSGTTSLEAGILGVPMVVCYKTSQFNYFLGRILVKTDVIEGIALPNIVLRKRVVPELLQNDFTAEKIFSEVSKYLVDENLYHNVRRELLKIRDLLKIDLAGKTTSEIVAEKILSKI